MTPQITKVTKEFKNTFFLVVFFAIYCVLAAVSSELSLWYNGKAMTGEYLFLTLGSSILSIILGILFWYLFTKKKGYKNNKFFLAIAILLFLGNTIALLAFPNRVAITPEFTFVSPFSFRLGLIISNLSLSIFIYNFYTFLFLLKKGKKSFAFVAEIIVIMAIFCIVISYFIDANKYLDFFNGKTVYIASILGHKNTFGMFVIFGLMAEIYLFDLDKKIWRLLLVAYLFASLYPINSKSSILCAMILLFGYILYCGFYFYHKNKKLSIVCFVIFAIAVIANGFLLIFPSSKDGVFSEFILACRSVFFGGDGTTIGARYVLYEKVIKQLNLSPLFWIFGYGNGNLQYSFYYACDDWSIERIAPTFHAHNGFIQCLACGGVYRLALYFAFLVYLAYRFIKKFKKTHDIHMFMSLLFFATFFARTLVEPEYLIGDSIRGVVYAFFIVEPILSNETEEALPFKWNYLSLFFHQYGTLFFGALASGCFVFASVYKARLGLTLFLPLGIILYGLFAYYSHKEKGNMMVFILTSALTLIISISLAFGLMGEASMTTLVFAYVYGFSFPFLSYLIYDCFFSSPICQKELLAA